MCLSIPSKIVEIDKDNMATVDTMGIKRQVSLDLMPDLVGIGDYILIHVGFAMSKIDEAEALQSLEVYQEMLEAMEEEERRQVIERNPDTIKALAWAINNEAKNLKEPLKIMEVCGGHTHTIMKYGLKQLLPDNIDFIHGPGCPVCIMPKERIDHAIALAQIEDSILLTLGDMIRVPGSKSSLALERAKGYDIRALYSPLDAIKIALENPDKKVIFFAIGFETTTPMTAAVLEQMEKRGIKNLYFHINHVLVPPAVDAIMADGQAKINAFIGPAHVSVITGAK
jgi:hydrogenase expression/formation protein HypD